MRIEQKCMSQICVEAKDSTKICQFRTGKHTVFSIGMVCTGTGVYLGTILN